jgi:hypothetical protein
MLKKALTWGGVFTFLVSKKLTSLQNPWIKVGIHLVKKKPGPGPTGGSMKRSLIVGMAFILPMTSAISSSMAQSTVDSAAPSAGSSSVKVGQVAYVSTDNLNVRSRPESNANNLLGRIVRGDLVEIVRLVEGTDFAEIKILSTKSFTVNPEKTYFVAMAFLSSEKQAPIAPATTTRSKYIVIQNIATERTRVYERCTETPDCAHRLVMETEMVVGRTEGPKESPDSYLTRAGWFRLTEWRKFYEDQQRLHASWYDPKYPPLPAPGASALDWIKKEKHQPNPETNISRGAFGWYAAFVGPNANYQWIHGTYGWGSEGDRFIRETRGWLANLVGNPRSSGCTRLENRAVAYLRHILQPGTDVIRVYAMEGYRDPSKKAYLTQQNGIRWDWILTKEDVRRNGATSDRNSVLARNVPADMILEQGSYIVDQYPNAVAFDFSASSRDVRKGQSGNTYELPVSSLRGVYLVDEGRFYNYSHPRGTKLPIGGIRREAGQNDLPDFVVSTVPATALTKGRAPRVNANNSSNRNPR